MAINKVLKVTTDAQLLSFIINQDPVLSSEIDLPVQGESIAPIGKIIMNNERYRNAFINTVNLIGLTVIKRNAWDDPWETFTNRGTLRYGQQIRELINDLCNVYDYNDERNTSTRFLENVVPNVYNYIHEINYQKFYEQTTSDEQMAMAFTTEGGLFDFIEQAISMLFESYKYDKYITNKYMLCRRILDGTVTSVKIDNYANLTSRQRVSFMKNISNKMAFRSPNYNPAGIRKATRHEDQILIMNTDFEADMSTEVLATSFFKNEAEFKTNMALIDGFSEHDTTRLNELLGDAFIDFTEDEINALKNIPVVIISREWFMDYYYSMNNDSGLKETQFYNPTTLKNNHYLHVWAVMSTSPFENACVFTSDTPGVTSVTVVPSTLTTSAGIDVQLSTVVDTTGFANKSVTYNVKSVVNSESTPVENSGVTVDLTGKVHLPKTLESGTVVTIEAISVYDTTKTGTSAITIA